MGKYHCTIDLLFDWFGIICMTTDNFCFYLQNRLIQSSQTGGQWYNDTSPFSIPWWNSNDLHTHQFRILLLRLSHNIKLTKPFCATQIRCIENSPNCISPIIDIVRLKLKQDYELLYLTPTFSLCFSYCQTDAKPLLLCQVKTIR